MPAVQRLFVALDLPDGIRATLAATPIDRATWRPIPESQLHITLAFLGNRPETDVARIALIIEAEHEAPELSLGNVRSFGRVLAAEITGDLQPLQARVAKSLEAAGVYTPEPRPFRPHVTLARLRPRTKPPRDRPLTLEPQTFHGAAVTLYASRLHPDGARYEALVTSRLGYIQP
ncbi:RNA 2',3'-cyclic phosphodiesterase [Solirubrobacter taibaiensis]|nr:RNA 2',3'-cyclic phosphodiesterase [Solirubrobacter taibaiensis]